MPLTPGLEIPFGIQPVNPVPVDTWSGPYYGPNETAAKAAANAAIPQAIRFQSLQPFIMGCLSIKFISNS